MTSFFALKYDVHDVHCDLFRQSSSQRLIFVLYPSRIRQIKCNTVWETKIRARAWALQLKYIVNNSSQPKRTIHKPPRYDKVVIKNCILFSLYILLIVIGTKNN